ncbi:MAG: alpha/beta hydrolase family protein [Armatimonadetes bacterium]|nr:alpha/beta hydrolase family protein [Armatimonadota bacterium]
MNGEFDPMPYLNSRYSEMPISLKFNGTKLEEAKKWQRRLRRTLTKLLGGFPKERCQLEPQILETRQLTTLSDEGQIVPYLRETLIFQSRPNLTVFGYFLKPVSNSDRLPVVICLPGHGRGVDDIVGINEDGSLRDRWDGYQRDFALQCVANGFAALAIEQLGFGHRREEAARRQGAGASSCQPLAGSALLLGETMIAWRVYDVMRAVDYLQTRNDVDSKRIAVMGISGGGTTSLFSAALDERIKVAVISGYFNTFKASIFSLSHCIDNYIPAILRYAEMPDIAGLIAPRPLHIENGTKDPIFPVEATKEAFERLKRIYEVFGASERLTLHIFEGEHEFNGKQAFPFLKNWL